MLPRPWDSPGKNTGVGCHFLLQCMKVKSESEFVQLCPTLCDPMDCSLPGSSVHGIFQARVLEWGAIAFSTDACETLPMDLIGMKGVCREVIREGLKLTRVDHEFFLLVTRPWRRRRDGNNLSILSSSVGT